MKDIFPEEINDITSKYSDDIEDENWTFDLKKEDWHSHVERLELYMDMKNVADDKNIAHLLAKVGMDMYKKYAIYAYLQNQKIKVSTIESSSILH